MKCQAIAWRFCFIPLLFYLCTMLEQVKTFVQQEKLFFRTNKLILAISGGIDSMVLLHLAQYFDCSIVVAHCNFQLRNAEADQDQLFVETESKKYNFECETIRFETEKYAQEQKVSIQVSARQLRYQWFEQLRQKHQADWILTAHHLNDNTETLLFNIGKGTGIKGLRGILPKQGKIIRPLLECTRTEIENYAKKHHIQYREDSSNASLKYSRNQIRQQVVPPLKNIIPNFENNQTNHFRRFREIEQFYNQAVVQIEKSLLENKKGNDYISFNKLTNIKGCKTLFYEILSKRNFNYTQVEEMLENINETQVGKCYFSATHRIIKDRKHFILSAIKQENPSIIDIQSSTEKVKLPYNELLRIHQKPIKKLTKTSSKKHFAYLDAEKLEFPLILRKWKEGDYFYPFGMYSLSGKAKKKKLKKYFADRKFSLADKENMWVLCSGQKIVWLVNERIDDRFKISEKTQKVYQIKWIECKN